jgi:hypothetical protein
MSRSVRVREKKFDRVSPSTSSLSTGSAILDDGPAKVYLQYLDLKNSFSFNIDVETTQSSTTQVKGTLNIEKLINPTSGNETYPTESYKLTARKTGPSDDFVGYVIDENTVSKNCNSLKFNFVDLTIYKLEFTVQLIDADGNYSKYEKIYNFKYYENPVKLNPGFSFDTNVGEGDQIEVTGLTLYGAPSDETVPQALDKTGNIIVPINPYHYINSSQKVVNIDGTEAQEQHGGPLIEPALRFTFQKVEGSAPVNTDDAYDSQGYNYNQDYNAPYEPLLLKYNSNGNYTLPANNLKEGTYKLKASAYWGLGYETTQVPYNYVHIINRPVIVSAVPQPLYLDDRTATVITIGVTFSGDENSDKVWFNFYNSSGDKVAKAGGANGLTFQTGTGTKYYNLSLNELELVDANSSLNGGVGILNGDVGILNGKYSVEAETKYTRSLPPTETLRYSDWYGNVIFTLVNPPIPVVTAYDVQNDGGVDGIHHTSVTDNTDAIDQIVATISLATTPFELYAPDDYVANSKGLRFNIYQNNVKVASTKWRLFKNNGNTYDIKLDDILLESGQLNLTNGTSYTIKAEVTLTKHNGTPDVPRLSAASNVFNFSQNIAPVPSVTISNTWELATESNPSSHINNFNNSPLIGVSGYFSKTAQFGSVYQKNLDVSTTKFRIQYKVKVGNNGIWGDWVLATRAVLGQKLSSSEAMYDAVARVKSQSIVVRANGEYDNIVPNTPTVGTSQPEMVFYIPQDQGNGNAFTESNEVQVEIIIVDTTNMWAGVNSSPRESNQIQLINRINTYSFIGGTPALVVANSVKSLEPWNSQNDAYYDSVTGVLHVEVNDSIIQAPKSNVKADSNNIIEELDQGWKIVNTGPNTNGAVNGALPKVILYSYGNVIPAAQQNPSNSFTLNQINGMGAYAVIDQHQGALEYPFFVAYTTPTGSNDNESWYKSKLFYAPSSSGNTTIDSSKVGPTLLYTGTDDAAYRPEIPSNRRVKLNLLPHDNFLTIANPTYATEKVKFVTVQTSSNANTSQAGSFNFTISETGLSTSSSVLTSLTMRFTTNLVLNIPLNWNSIHAHSVKVTYNYSGLQPKTLTFNHADLPIESDIADTQARKYVSLFVKPTSGANLYYTVAYIVNNTNLSVAPKTTEGLTSELEDVPNKGFPVSSDYTVTVQSYKTFNNLNSLNSGESSITFTLTNTLSQYHEMDGINVYFTSPESQRGSNIPTTRIQSYLIGSIGSVSSSSAKTIQLLNSSGETGGYLNIMNNQGTIDLGPEWENYDMANITFEAFRDRRVITRISSLSFPLNSKEYIESAPNSFTNSIWNVPVLKKPSTDGTITLTGGVINSNTDTTINWEPSNDDNGVAFKYDITVKRNDDISTIKTVSDKNSSSQSVNIDGVFLTNNVAKYTVSLYRVFNGTNREVSLPDVLEFYSIKVDTSAVILTVQPPSSDQYVNLSWIEPTIQGSSITLTGSENASFINNIVTHRIVYTTTDTASPVSVPTVLDTQQIVRIGNGDKKQYELPDKTLGTLYNFSIFIEANVAYTLSSSPQSTIKSNFVPIPYVPLNPTPASQYIVSTVPSVEPLPHSTPVLTQNSPNNPTLLLNLNANGLEDEGFVSVVVILTQDGTAAKPEGEQALLIFPDFPNPNQSHPLHPFSFPNHVTGVSGLEAGDVRLAGGESATSTPRNVDESVLSTQTNSYTLTIGTVGTNGRYGLSTLEMPSSQDSGFVSGSPVNYMIILTTRRGTDIGVGEFTYQAVPQVSNVQIVTENGQYYVQFNMSPA